QLVQQFLAEGVVLSLLGGGLGIALAQPLLQAIVALMPDNTLPLEADVRLSLPVLAFTLAVSVASGLLVGCAPARQAVAGASSGARNEAGSAFLGGRRGRALRRAFVVAQLALALTLLTAGGLAVRNLARLTGSDLGFPIDRLLTFRLQPSGQPQK